MNRKNSIGINAILNVIKTLMSIIFPLITFPYVTRILGAENLGKINYAQSIVSYFSLISAMGISTYAVREGAQLKGNTTRFQKFSNEIFFINILTTLIAYMLEIAIIFLYPGFRNYRKLIFLLSTSIFFNAIGVDWINYIFEDFLYITIKSIAIHVLNLCLLFIFVKNNNDIYIYAILIVFTQIMTCILNFFYCKKYIKIRVSACCSWKIHIKPMLILFANNMAITIYCNVDATMLGLITKDYYVGIYAVAVKVYSMLRSLLAATLTVCVPRLSTYLGNNDTISFTTLLNDISHALILVTVPIIVGIFLLAEPIVLFLGGTEYIDAVNTLRILGISLVFAIFGGILTNCVNLPLKKDKINLKATVIAATINVLLNLIAIPVLKHEGAAITTVIAETCVIFICLKMHKNGKIFIKNEIIEAIRNSMIGIVPIIVVCCLTKHYINKHILICAVATIVSISVYGLVLIFLKDKIALRVMESSRKLFGMNYPLRKLL